MRSLQASWDIKTDDKRIKGNLLSLPSRKGLQYHFKSVGRLNTAPEFIRIRVSKGKSPSEVLGESQGGGLINITEVNGFKADFSANLHTAIITADDVKGSVAFIASVLAHDDCNIATMSVPAVGSLIWLVWL